MFLIKEVIAILKEKRDKAKRELKFLEDQIKSLEAGKETEAIQRGQGYIQKYGSFGNDPHINRRRGYGVTT